VSKESIRLKRREDRQLVEAALLGELRPDDLQLIERAWTVSRQEIMRELVSAGIQRSLWPESLHWDWSLKAKELRYLSYNGFAVECEGEFQGVLLVNQTGHFADLEEDRGKPLVYIEYLEVAPWNWNVPSLNQAGRFGLAGTVLFQRAVEYSNEQEFAGRIGLHALPAAEQFYEQVCGMQRFGQDPNKEGLVYFELSRAAAAARL
jgi:hypothetical protein